MDESLELIKSTQIRNNFTQTLKAMHIVHKNF
jgi:hypothetical protein